jgi:hypothetical protein
MVVAYPPSREEIERAWAVMNDLPVAQPGELSFPWDTTSQPGDFVSAGIPLRTLGRGRHSIRFRERDDFTGPTSGYHFKQVLVNGGVVWEEDAAGGTNGWREVKVDLPSFDVGTVKPELAFRLFDKQGVSNFGLRWELADLKVEGFDIPARLDQPQNWTVKRRGAFEAGFGEGTKPPQHRFKVPFIVMTAGQASEFRLRHGEPASPERMAEWLRMCLQACRDGKCDGVATYCLEKEPNSRTFDLARKVFGEYR